MIAHGVSLNGLAWADDKQVVEIVATRYDCRRGEQAIILTIEGFDG